MGTNRGRRWLVGSWLTCLTASLPVSWHATKCQILRNNSSKTFEHEFLHGRQDSAELIDEFFDKYSRPLDLLVGKLDAQCFATDDPRLKER
jgi:hypothetical protein